MMTTVASPLTQDQMLVVVDEPTRQPSSWRKWVVKIVLQPFLWAAWVRSKVILREDW
ncbi:hypothetical protein SPB21_00460 [Leptothoe sp. ISB3NOV94-8A]|uniref:hypothetical protein n=1 Tax=Adonisia turfae TaxID=2950184 RepID=UPI0002E97901|nr:hypothetical protein [Adonisia turfae]MDV3352138.1 hypothetical protein [Leptothoe sp. LEGE 181152]